MKGNRTPGSHVATGCNWLVVIRARYCSSFELTHMSCEDHAQSIESAMAEDKKLLQCSQLRQHGEFRHVSISEWQQHTAVWSVFVGPS